MTELAKQLEQWDTIEKNHLQPNRPVWPFKKPDRIWHMTTDCRAFNESAPSPFNSPCSQQSRYEHGLLQAGMLATKDTVFMIPIQQQEKPQFAFTWSKRQNTFYHSPQGFKHGPTFSQAMLAKEIESIILPPEVTIGRYDNEKAF